MNFIKFIQFSLLSLLLGHSITHAQDSANFDVQKGNWQLYFQDPETQQWVTKFYEARTAIRPAISSRIRWNGATFTYHYTVKNERIARQNLSVIRVWGIPLIYSVPNLPPVTASQKTDGEGWTHQYWAQLSAKEKFQQDVVKAPPGWTAGLRVDANANQTSFVWTPGLKETDSYGVVPGSSQGGFMVFRPELPGLARTYLQGRIDEPWGLDNLPDTPFWSQKVDEIQDQDFLLVPVLAPVITVPMPYNGADLARSVKAHTQTWLKYGHVRSEVLDRLNRQFDVLIPALEGNNKNTARAAAVEMFKEIFGHHAGLNHHKLDDDDEEHAANAMPQKSPANSAAARTLPSTAPIDRIAARSLAFNLMYLLTRMEKGS